MNYAISALYRTNRPASARDAYRVTIIETDAALSPMRQHGPNYNNAVYYGGVFATREEAEAEERGFLGGAR